MIVALIMPILRMFIITNISIVMLQENSLNYIILKKKKQIFRHKILILTLTKHHHHDFHKEDHKVFLKVMNNNFKLI